MSYRAVCLIAEILYQELGERCIQLYVSGGNSGSIQDGKTQNQQSPIMLCCTLSVYVSERLQFLQERLHMETGLLDAAELFSGLVHTLVPQNACR